MDTEELKRAWAAVPDRAIVMFWQWDLTNGNTEGLSDFVVIARDVSPHTMITEAAVLCVAPVGPAPTRAITNFQRGSRILWGDVAQGMLVMVFGGSVAYKHADGSGRWVREGFEAWGDGERWTWLEAARHCVQPVCGVLATGVLDARLVRDTVGGLDARVELET